MLGVQILLPLPRPSSQPVGFHGCFSLQLWAASGSIQLVGRAAHPHPDGCKTSGKDLGVDGVWRLWGEGSTHSQALCLPLLLSFVI